MTKSVFSYGLGLIAAAFLLMACNDDNKTEKKAEEPDKITVSNVTPNSFSATITGMFSGISKTDLALGKSGILYCEASDNAESIFKSWKEGNDNVDCHIYAEGKNVSDTYTGTITGLLPETEYSFCLFSQGKDKSVREISAVHKFSTVAFSPKFSEPRVENIYYFDAVGAGSVKMNSDELASCSAGFAVSTTESVNAENSLLFQFDGTDLAHLSVKLEGLKDNTEYYGFMFVKYPTASGDYEYKFSEGKKFTTRDLMNTAIDLGLPSGIRWGTFDFGEYDFASQFEDSPVYYWGCDKPMVVYITNDAHYVMTEAENDYYDKETQTYAYLGDEISGTQYDPVHRKYGGKWRMPTKAEMDELLEYCSVSSRKERVKENVFYLSDYDAYISDYVYYYEVKGPNGNIVKMRLYTILWSGTMCDASGFPEGTDYWKDGIYIMYISGGTEKIYTSYVTRGSRASIRPVWDPNFAE